MFVKLMAILCLATITDSRINSRSYTKEKLQSLRDETASMFYHAYESYLNNAYPYDELRPLSCDGVDTWGSYSLTLIDALDTLAVLGNYTEFNRVYTLLSQRSNFDNDINVSVFETNIRILGGLLSGHLMAKRAGIKVDPGWPCEGPLLRLAEDVAQRLLPAFDTPTGMPYGTVNLKHGVPEGETPITCTAGVSTFIVEFGSLSRLTGESVYEEAALRALRALWHHRSSIGLVGNHIDVLTGKWTATDSGIGAGVDSYFEYLVKGSILFQRPELMKMFKISQEAIEQHLKHDDWHFWVSMHQGTVSLPVFQSLEAFWPGSLSLVGENVKAMKTIHNYQHVWKQYGFLPEFYNVAQGVASSKREGYPLRPELVESAMYLYRTTRDPFLLTIGEDMLNSIKHSAKTNCGYATVKDARDHTLEDRMESFFLAETTKYLYLLFDTENFIHNNGGQATSIETKHGTCILDSGGYVFNTEAHPIDPAALNCCSNPNAEEIKKHISENMLDILDPSKFSEFQGDLISTRILEIQKIKKQEEEERRKRKEEFLKRAEELRKKELEVIRRKKELEALRRQKLEELKRQEDEEDQDFEDLSMDVDEDEVHSQNLSFESKEYQDLSKLEVVEEIVIEKSKKMNDFQSDEPIAKEISEETLSSEEEQQSMIKRQSKDESVNPIIQDKHLSEKLKESSKRLLTENVVDTLTDFVNNLIPGLKDNNLLTTESFDFDSFKAKVLNEGKFPLKDEWYQDHYVMCCPAPNFYERFSVQGEFFL